MLHPPLRQIRARFTDQTVRVYQAYSNEIADRALAAQKFVSPFRRERMTWIKPSFAWMMYRAGWGTKSNQERVLGIDISRSGFEWALGNASLSHFELATHGSYDQWQAQLQSSPVRIQWDPERDLNLAELPWRAIQVGIGGHAVDFYVDEWISTIEDVTPLAKEVKARVDRGDLNAALDLAPIEKPYPLPESISSRIGHS
jgi:hypothetical protein